MEGAAALCSCCTGCSSPGRCPVQRSSHSTHLSPQPPPLHLGILPLVYLCTLQGWGEGLVFRMDSSSFLLVAVGEVTPHLSCLASWSAGQPLTLLSPSTAQQREGCDSPPRPEAPCRGTIPSRLTCCALTCSRVDICPPSCPGDWVTSSS